MLEITGFGTSRYKTGNANPYSGRRGRRFESCRADFLIPFFRLFFFSHIYYNTHLGLFEIGKLANSPEVDCTMLMLYTVNI